MKNMKFKLAIYLSFLSTVIFPSSSYAYVGPGAALSLLGSVLGFSVLVSLGIIFSLAWPLWAIYKYLTNKKR